MGLNPGAKLGPYEILAPLGSGGMGEVYRAMDTRLNRNVAIKILPLHLSSRPDSRERFEREARAISALSHPNICHLYDIGTQDRISYLVLEFLEGETLAARLKKGSVPFAETLRFGLEVADALVTAHHHGIVHRDIKPGNIFLTTHGECKVLDFGLASLSAEDSPSMDTAIGSAVLTSPGSAIGTLPYMSPEQARGELLDARTDVFSLGAVLYEMATGKRAFDGKTQALVFKAILDDALPQLPEVSSKFPQGFAEILSKALEKDRQLRYQSAAEIRSDLQRLKRDVETDKTSSTSVQPGSRRNFWQLAAVAAIVAVMALLAIILLSRDSPRVTPGATKWEQLTFFTDSAVYPELSPDGRMLTFIRGDNTFLGRGQIYVKFLPSGEPVQLTHDTFTKLSPVFFPDGSNIAYGTVDPWDTWEVPVLGGEPRLFARNASSLTWIPGGKRLLFSEMKQGLRMAVVTTDESRSQSRDVYIPPGERGMVHHSYLSPDGRWVLAVVMNNEGKLIPCQVVPFDGSSSERVVGPPDATCTSGAWSPDGKWIYISSNKGGRFHIWRQKFPDGTPEQVTSGPTEEEGISIAADGKSMLTSVGILDSTIWVHDSKGDRQFSSEGNAFATSFSSDGSKLYYLKQSGQDPGAELWVTELASGKTEPALPGNSIEPGLVSLNYAVSGDDKQIVFAKKDQNGVSHLWVAAADRRAPPRQLPSTSSDDSPGFLPDGELLFRAIEGGGVFLYRSRTDGSGRRKVVADTIFDFMGLSPDGRWALVQVKGPGDQHPHSFVAAPVEGGQTVHISNSLALMGWNLTGSLFYMTFGPNGTGSKTYLLPVHHARGLPDLPAQGVLGGDDLKNMPGVLTIPYNIDSLISPDSYSYTRQTTRRNIYRVPLP